MASLALDDVVSVVGDSPVLNGVTFEVDDGQFVALIGGSGAGKTSIVRAVAGFDSVVRGTVSFDGHDMTRADPGERDLAMVSQGNTLFPTHTVRKNLSFPLISRAFGRAESRKRVEAEARAQRIDHVLDRKPNTLSPGEKRLAHIARALVRTPRVLLMDEPTANLDPTNRDRLRRELVTLQRGYGVTTLYVSNRDDEILSMPDRVLAVEGGRIIQDATPQAIRRDPQSLTIAQLTGTLGTLEVGVERGHEGFWLTGPGIRVRAWAPRLANYVGQSLTLAVRPEDVHVDPQGSVVGIVGRLNFESMNRARDICTPVGTIASFDHDLTECSEQAVRITRWHLFERGGRLICSGH